MKFDDVYLMVEILLVAAAIAFFLALAALVAGLIFMAKAADKLMARTQPLIERDRNGRPFKERL